MRTKISANGLSVKAYAGTTGVLLAFNIDDALRPGFLGFAIERWDGQKKEWLSGMIPFPDMPHQPGQLIPSNQAPFQKFRWSDYRVYPDREYEYTIYPVYGSSQLPKLEQSITVKVKTAGVSSGEHSIIFNRAAAASQAFSRKFPEVEAALKQARKAKVPAPELPVAALDWLSRGVLEQITGFIQLATDASWGLDLAIYEYELPAIVEAVNAAHARGVRVRIVYHAKAGDPQTTENQANLQGLPALSLRPRETKSICHHKFIVLTQIQGGNPSPTAVLCGSTNFTMNGVYRQANVVHVARQADVAQQYLVLFETLFRGDSPADTRTYITANNPISGSGNPFVGFSPRKGKADLNHFSDLIQSAKRDVLFCTAFDLYNPIETALLGEANDPILRYGLQNSRSTITGIHQDRTADFVSAAMLSTGLEGFLKESTKGQKGNILIHTKLIVVDFTSDAPLIISGSHNFSENASNGNDENYLIFQGHPDIADCYGCELMRLYDHYRFRFRAKNSNSSRPMTLKTDQSWTNKYFDPTSLSFRDRQNFSGEEI
jgi:phosphatidylserine/phosphatidylglycerophosphate/cardiolipin synthase-like enzyme